MNIVRCWSLAIMAVLALALPTAAVAQRGSAHLNASFQMTFDCERPFTVRNHPIRAEFVAVLNADKSATADLAIQGILLTNHVHFDARLGGRPQPGPGGTTTQLRVVSSSRLRAVWDLPNNQIILDISTGRASCSVSPQFRLKPGRREYTMFDGHRFHYCSNKRLISTTCQVH
jgi:hypothetical protein